MQKAKEISRKAYAPYSNFPVGACVLTSSGNTYVGCNVENSSYGLTVCAERNAVASAVANGEKNISAVAIYSPKRENCLPCGACRQVIGEFRRDSEIEIITESENKLKIFKFNEIMPGCFKL